MKGVVAVLPRFYLTNCKAMLKRSLAVALLFLYLHLIRIIFEHLHQASDATDESLQMGPLNAIFAS